MDRGAFASEAICIQSFHEPLILHAYSGSADTTQKLLDHNVYFSIAGNIFKKSISSIHDTLRMIPASRMLVETDSPNLFLPDSLSPRSLSGKNINSPANLFLVIRRLSEVLNKSHDDIVRQIWGNSCTTFCALIQEENG